MKKIKLFCFGFGQVAKYFVKKLINEKYNLSLVTTNTTKTKEKFFEKPIFLNILVLIFLRERFLLSIK